MSISIGRGGISLSGGRAWYGWGVATVAASDSSTFGANARYVCDGTADDVQIQSAIDEVATAGGGVVLLSDGQFTLAATLTMKTGVAMVGVGDATELFCAVDLDDNSGLIEAATAATRFAIADLTINGDGVTRGATYAGNGIYLTDATEGQISNVNFRNIGYSKTSMRACVRLSSGCADITIDSPRGISVQATPTLWYGVYDGGATRTVLRNPYFYGFGDEPVVFSLAQDFVWDGGRVCYGADNTAGNGAKGAHITATGGTCRGTISNVESDHNYSDGFRIDTGAGGVIDVTVFGCNAHHNTNVGISCAASARLMFNRCWSNAGGSTNAGIAVLAANCTLVGNMCYDNGTAGIYALAGTTDMIAQGNTCTNIAGTAQNYGIVVSSGVSEVTLIGNNFAGNLTTPIQLDGTAISLFDWLGSALNVSGLPASDPGVAGRPWLNSNVLTVSTGA